MADKENKALTEIPPQGASYVVSLPQPPVRNSEEYLKAYIGYIYTAVGAIAQEVASIDLHLYKVDYVAGKPRTTEIFEHPLLSVLNYVNQIATFYDAVEATQTYLELTGEAYWAVLKNGKVPTEFWLLRPDWVKVIPSAKDVIDHYNYYAGGVISEKVEIPKENIIPFKYFHPMNPYRGKGATQAAALPFDILNFAQEYNRNFFFNSAIPSMVFSTEQKISEQTVKRFLNQWQSSFGGRSKSNKVAFLGNGMKLDKASFTANELSFTEQMKSMRDDVLAVFKVPKTVLGLTEDVNKANAQATTTAFMERVITPRMRKFVDSLNEFFVPMFDDSNTLFLDFKDPSPEDVELQLKKYESMRTLGWGTSNEIRIAENLEPMPGGDDLTPVGKLGGLFGGTPANPNTTKPTPAPDQPSNPESDPNKPTDEGKGFFDKLFGKKALPIPYVSSAKKPTVRHMVHVPVKRLEVLKQEEMAQAFVAPLKKFIAELIVKDEYSKLAKKKVKQDVIDDIKQAFEKKTEVKVPPTNSDWSEEKKLEYWKIFIQHVTEREASIKEKCKEVFLEQQTMTLTKLQDRMKSWRVRLGRKAMAADVIPTLEELDKMWTILVQLLREIYIEQGNYTMDYLGAGGTINITTEFASQYLVEYGGKLISGIDNTTRDSLMRSLSDGFDNGESIDALSKRVQDVFVIADDNRAEMIARTEAVKASNAASVEAYRQSGVVVAKEWLAEEDERTCGDCMDMDGKSIALDSDYNLDGFDDVGEPPLHVDCRCTTIPVIDTSMQGEPDTGA